MYHFGTGTRCANGIHQADVVPSQSAVYQNLDVTNNWLLIRIRLLDM